VNTHLRFFCGVLLTGVLAVGACAVARVTFDRLARVAPPPSAEAPRSVSGGFFPVEISPHLVELGVVSQGQLSKAALTLTNRGSRELLIDRLETSCPCLMITPSQLRLAPAESKIATVLFDPSDEPDFHGKLCIDISGYSTGSRAFQTVAEVEVRNEAASRASRLRGPATFVERQP
jgi:hypothetical protein